MTLNKSRWQEQGSNAKSEGRQDIGLAADDDDDDDDDDLEMAVKWHVEMVTMKEFLPQPGLL